MPVDGANTILLTFLLRFPKLLVLRCMFVHIGCNGPDKLTP